MLSSNSFWKAGDFDSNCFSFLDGAFSFIFRNISCNSGWSNFSKMAKISERNICKGPIFKLRIRVFFAFFMNFLLKLVIFWKIISDLHYRNICKNKFPYPVYFWSTPHFEFTILRCKALVLYVPCLRCFFLLLLLFFENIIKTFFLTAKCKSLVF